MISPLVLGFGFLLAAGTAYTAFWVAYLLVLPLFGAVLPERRNGLPITCREGVQPTLVVIIPAHNMGSVIERSLAAIQTSDYPAHAFSVYVVVDHCSDDTAVRAAAAGATVLVRDQDPAGKTYSIAWALEILAESGVMPDLYVVTDATARIDRRFLSSLVNYWRRGEDIIVGHSVVDMENQQWFAQCLGLTLVHRNLQNAAREQLRLSSLIEGRGMAYSAEYIRRHGWSLALPTATAGGTHPTEDWRHGVRVVEHGHRVSFASEALVVTPLRDTISAATRQGVRWERGRMANAGSHGLSLLRRSVGSRNRLMVFAALDAIQPPVAVLAAACFAMAGLGLLASRWLPFLALVSAFPALFIIAYGGVIIARGRKHGIRARTVLWAPIYVAWRCYAFALAWVQGLRGKP